MVISDYPDGTNSAFTGIHKMLFVKRPFVQMKILNCVVSHLLFGYDS